MEEDSQALKWLQYYALAHFYGGVEIPDNALRGIKMQASGRRTFTLADYMISATDYSADVATVMQPQILMEMLTSYDSEYNCTVRKTISVDVAKEILDAKKTKHTNLEFLKSFVTDVCSISPMHELIISIITNVFIVRSSDSSWEDTTELTDNSVKPKRFAELINELEPHQKSGTIVCALFEHIERETAENTVMTQHVLAHRARYISFAVGNHDHALEILEPISNNSNDSRIHHIHATILLNKMKDHCKNSVDLNEIIKVAEQATERLQSVKVNPASFYWGIMTETKVLLTLLLYINNNYEGITTTTDLQSLRIMSGNIRFFATSLTYYFFEGGYAKYTKQPNISKIVNSAWLTVQRLLFRLGDKAHASYWADFRKIDLNEKQRPAIWQFYLQVEEYRKNKHEFSWKQFAEEKPNTFDAAVTQLKKGIEEDRYRNDDDMHIFVLVARYSKKISNTDLGQALDGWQSSDGAFYRYIWDTLHLLKREADKLQPGFKEERRGQLREILIKHPRHLASGQNLLSCLHNMVEERHIPAVERRLLEISKELDFPYFEGHFINEGPKYTRRNGNINFKGTTARFWPKFVKPSYDYLVAQVCFCFSAPAFVF